MLKKYNNKKNIAGSLIREAREKKEMTKTEPNSTDKTREIESFYQRNLS